MTNAKEELLRIVTKCDSSIKAALITLGDEEFSEPEDVKKFLLRENHSEQELTAFLNNLDFSYDDGYGGQELFGVVWLDDGTWLERGEYDGSEWWEQRKLPEIPDYLKDAQK